MYDNYCTLEEAWGKDFKKEDKKKKKRERENQRVSLPSINDTVDDQILIAPPHEWSMVNPQEQRKKMESSKPMVSNLMSTNELRPYQNVREQRNFHYPESNLSDIVNITRKEYENLKG